MRTRLLHIILGLALFSSAQVKAQKVLKTEMTVAYANSSLELVLSDLENRGDFQFSYNALIIDLHEHNVTYRATNEPLDKILKDVIPVKVKLLERGSYVIIRDARRKNKEKHRISGTIYDANSGQPLSGVSVYEVDELSADLSSGSGSYDLEFTEDAGAIQIGISKANYRDTVIQLERNYTGPINVKLTPISDSALFEQNSRADSMRFVKRMAGRQALEHTKNVQFFQEKYAQVSFLPFLGTNKKFGGRTKNHVSLNVLAGYNHSLEGIEVAGFANIDRYDVRGVQVAGFSNIVGRETSGFQAAGFVNVNKRKIQGAQLAGFTNIAVDTLYGFQASGFTNIGPYTKGVQLSGFVNTTWSGSKAYQLTGFVNYTKSNAGGQAAGFVNFALKKHTGVQVAGFMNYSHQAEGVQIAGFTNVASGRLGGVQIAGFVNYAAKMRGVQIAPINICDSVESGVPIGLLNIVRKGMFEAELSISSFQYTVRLRTGTARFYNILSAGYDPLGELFSFGYGIGNMRVYQNGFTRGIELQANQLLPEVQSDWETLNMASTLYPYFGFEFSNSIRLISGPELAIYVADPGAITYTNYNDPRRQNHLWTDKHNGITTTISIGYRVGLTF